MAWLKRNKSGYATFKEGDKTKLVHRRVAEKKLGGSIFKGYEVHHKNGNKTDNRPANLRVMKKSSHRRLHAKKRRSSIW